MADISNLKSLKVYENLCDPKNDEWGWCIVEADQGKHATVIGHGNSSFTDFLNKFNDDKIQYGVYRVFAIDNQKSSVPSKRLKLIFFTFMGAGVNQMKRTRNLETKASIRAYFHAHVEMDINDKSLTEHDIETKLTDSAGAFKPDAYEFGTGHAVITPVANGTGTSSSSTRSSKNEVDDVPSSSTTTSTTTTTPVPPEKEETIKPEGAVKNESMSKTPVAIAKTETPVAIAKTETPVAIAKTETPVAKGVTPVAAVVIPPVDAVKPSPAVPATGISHVHNPTPFPGSKPISAIVIPSPHDTTIEPSTVPVPPSVSSLPIPDDQANDNVVNSTTEPDTTNSSSSNTTTELVTSPEVGTTSPVVAAPNTNDNHQSATNLKIIPEVSEDNGSYSNTKANDNSNIDIASAVFGDKKQGMQSSSSFQLRPTAEQNE